MPTSSTRAASQWFAARDWRVFAFQRQTWRAMLAARSGLVHASTGSGKTYAVWWGALLRAQVAYKSGRTPSAKAVGRASRHADAAPPLTILWITPMRALATDTFASLAQPLQALEPHWTIGLRTGDTPAAERARQNRRLPFALITTPESLSLLLAQADSDQRLRQVQTVIVDEWHELIGSKRGVQVQLALARLRRFNPDLIVWGLSATLGNLDDAMQVLCAPVDSIGPAPELVQGRVPKRIKVDTLVPADAGRFPWGGHLGLVMREPVIREIAQGGSTLVFCNTRSQAELWFHALLEARPDWAGELALHHGSLDFSVRRWVENGLKQGRLRVVVCTASLDLGVDFSPVDRVLQVGSAKGVARLLQRAGRAGHAPGQVSRVTLVPTNALELIEAAAVQDAVAARRIEARVSPQKPLDVLVQHLVTVALGTGFEPADLLAEVRSCHAYRALTDAEFQWSLDFVVRGGPSLMAYPEYVRVQADEQGVYRVPDRGIARRHRMSIGTIVADSAMSVRFLAGGRIGSIEESFISRLRRGDCFLFNGRLLELVRVHEMTAYVRRASGRKAAIPRWGGSTMPLSSELADAVLQRLADAADGVFEGPEMKRVRPLIETQQQLSRLPGPDLLVLEQYRSREGWHLFVHPFAGRHVHIGLASLFALRLARAVPASFSIAVNDYGFELFSPSSVDWTPLLSGEAMVASDLLEDVLASLNSAELAQRRFREIARVSGLVFQGYPGAPKATRQLQASASLFFEVFRNHDPDNLLLRQAEREVLDRELEIGRLERALAAMRARELAIVELTRPSPLAFALMVERLREKLSTEKLADRITRMLADMERQIDPAPSRPRRKRRRVLS